MTLQLTPLKCFLTPEKTLSVLQDGTWSLDRCGLWWVGYYYSMWTSRTTEIWDQKGVTLEMVGLVLFKLNFSYEAFCLKEMFYRDAMWKAEGRGHFWLKWSGQGRRVNMSQDSVLSLHKDPKGEPLRISHVVQLAPLTDEETGAQGREDPSQDHLQVSKAARNFSLKSFRTPPHCFYLCLPMMKYFVFSIINHSGLLPVISWTKFCCPYILLLW